MDTTDRFLARGSLSGRWVVVGMICFGILLTVAMWVYWKLHLGPFVPLQQALAAEFYDSRPRVEGGQRKMHKNTPRILRITMKVEFDPTADAKSLEQFAGRVAHFARENYELGTYDRLEVHLYHPEPEGELKQSSATFDVPQLLSGSDVHPKP